MVRLAGSEWGWRGKGSCTIPSRNCSSPGRKKPPAQQASKAKNFKNQNLDGQKENMINPVRNQATQCSLPASDFKPVIEVMKKRKRETFRPINLKPQMLVLISCNTQSYKSSLVTVFGCCS